MEKKKEVVKKMGFLNKDQMRRHKEIRESKREVSLENRSKKAGFYVKGHKNFGDVYEA